LFGWSEQKTGKDHWRAGSALLRPAKAVCIPLAKYQPYWSLWGTNHLAMAGPTGQTIVMWYDDRGHMPGVGESNFPLLLRDATQNSFMEFGGHQCLWGFP
jgi:hypothetical protein